MELYCPMSLEHDHNQAAETLFFAALHFFRRLYSGDIH
jgi:hypothetical protein